MKRPDDSTTYRAGAHHRPAYTLVEILTATVLMIVIMMAVTVIFASVTDSIGQSRATLEMSQRLRATAAIVKQDLGNVTAVMNPPLHPRDNIGYFQYVEGPIGPIIDPANVAWNSELDLPDTTVGDIDDILMFTATTDGEPYVGLIDGQPSVSNSAEIIYFIRGTTLYRRVLLVKPEVNQQKLTTLTDGGATRNFREVNRSGFYGRFDLSVHKTWDDYTATNQADGEDDRPVLVANTLADLTRPECRFAHNPDPRAWTASSLTPTTGVGTTPKLARGDGTLRYWSEGKPFPFFLRPWLGSPYPDPIDSNFVWVPGLGLPILAECSDPAWVAGDVVPSENNVGINVNNTATQMPKFPNTIVPTDRFDAWDNPHPWLDVDPLTGVTAAYANGTRPGDDVILTNVIGFDVKAWDPDAPVFIQTAFDSAGTPIDNVVVSPGDPGYISTLNRLRNRILANTVASSGIAAMTGAYADLNYMARIDLSVGTSVYPHLTGYDRYNNTLPIPNFHGQGQEKSLAYGTRAFFVHHQQPYDYFPAVYDTWSLHFEFNRHTINYVSENPTNNNRNLVTVGNEDRDNDTSGNQLYDEATNGLDDDTANGVDDIIDEPETQPPYRIPLQGIQVRIRVFEPGSRQVREVTLVQKFRTE